MIKEKIIMESTPHGRGNYFYEQWIKLEKKPPVDIYVNVKGQFIKYKPIKINTVTS